MNILEERRKAAKKLGCSQKVLDSLDEEQAQAQENETVKVQNAHDAKLARRRAAGLIA